MTMTVFTGMMKFQPLVEVVMVMVTSHSPVISRLLCKLNLLIYLKRKTHFGKTSPLAAFSVFWSSETMVMGPTPPGTGVILEANL